MRQFIIIFVFLAACGFGFPEETLSALTLDLAGAPRNLQRGSLLTVNILATDSSDLDGVAVSLIYPGNVLYLDSKGVTTTAFDTHRDELANESGVGSYWSAGTEKLGNVYLTGLFKNHSAAEVSTGPLTLFSVYFRVRNVAATGIHTMRLFQSQLCNGPAGWGTDNNNNGVLDNLDNDKAEFVPLGYAFLPDTGTGRDDTDGVGTTIIMDGFDEPPLFVFNVLDGYAEVTTPDDPADDSNGDTTVNPNADSDNDGVPDNLDECPDDPLKIEPGTCGCGVLDTDSDNDGIPDCHDVLISPANGARDVSLSPVMEVEPFPRSQSMDADPVIVWQVSRDDTFTDLLFEYTGALDVTSIRLPDFILDAYTTYYWRIRYGSGPWEVAGEFTTGPDPIRDDDGNGIPDDQDITGTAVRANVITAGDNGKVLQSGQNGLQYSLLAGSEVETVERFRWQDAADFENVVSWPVDFAAGLLSFRLKLAAVGATANVTIGFSEKMAAGSQWWKTTVDQTVYDFDQYAVFAEDMRSVTLTVTDGGTGDLDGVANGVIIDPGGIVRPETGGGNGGGGGSSGCFVDVCLP